jgi:hypothetical protein
VAVADNEQRTQSSREPNSRQSGARFLPPVQVIGWTFVLLVLAGYFAWMVIEMGAHAPTGVWPMVGVFAAAVAAGAAATLGLIIGRRRGD